MHPVHPWLLQTPPKVGISRDLLRTEAEIRELSILGGYTQTGSAAEEMLGRIIVRGRFRKEQDAGSRSHSPERRPQLLLSKPRGGWEGNKRAIRSR